MASLRTRENDTLCGLVREKRKAAGLSQEGLSLKLKRPITYLGKIEVGTRRLDLIELAEICAALEADLVALVAEWQGRLAA